MAFSMLATGAVLAVILSAISLIDAKTMRIPNALSLALASLGIGYVWLENSHQIFIQLGFALFVLIVMFSLQQVFLRFKGKQGLGMGDVKMFGASSLWISPWYFPYFLFAASASALLFVAVRSGFSNSQADMRLPFGPFISIALFALWIWQEI